MNNWSPRRMVAESVRDNLRRSQDALAKKQCDRAACHISWHKHHEFAIDPGINGLAWNAGYAKRRDEALAGYDREIAELEKEVKLWEDALSHALDSLEQRG